MLTRHSSYRQLSLGNHHCVVVLIMNSMRNLGRSFTKLSEVKLLECKGIPLGSVHSIHGNLCARKGVFVRHCRWWPLSWGCTSRIAFDLKPKCRRCRITIPQHCSRMEASYPRLAARGVFLRMAVSSKMGSEFVTHCVSVFEL